MRCFSCGHRRKKGEFFTVDKDESIKAFAANLGRYRAGYLTAMKGAGAFTSGVKIGVDLQGINYVENVKARQLRLEFECVPKCVPKVKRAPYQCP